MNSVNREHDEKWRFRKPSYDDFGIRADEVERIISAHEKINDLGELSYSEEIQQKERRYFKRRLRADNISLVMTWIIIGLIAFGCIYHFTGGLNKKTLHAALYFYIILCAGGFIVLPFAYSIVNRPVENIIDHFVRKDDAIEKEKQAEEKEYQNILRMAQKYDDLCLYEAACEEYDYWNKINEGIKKEDNSTLRRAIKGFLEEKGYKNITPSTYANIELEAVYNGVKYGIFSKSSGDSVSVDEMESFADSINSNDIDKALFFSLVDFSEAALNYANENEVPIICVSRKEIIDQSW